MVIVFEGSLVIKNPETHKGKYGSINTKLFHDHNFLFYFPLPEKIQVVGKISIKIQKQNIWGL